MDKLVTASAAVSSIPSGSTLVLPDPGGAGFPGRLVTALGSVPAEGFTVICPGAPRAAEGLRKWLGSGQITRLIVDSEAPGGRLEGVEAEFVPPALLKQRLQASAAGTPTFLGPVGTHERPVEDGARAMFFGDDEFGPVPALTPDFALVRAVQGDPKGNLVFADEVREAVLSVARAAHRTLAEIDTLIPVLHPRLVQLPARHVQSVVGAAAKVRG